MKKAPLSVARRYARALLDVALEKGAADALRAELESAATLLDEHTELGRALTHPALSGDKKKKISEQVFKSATPLLARLLTLLAERDRVTLVPAIRDVYTELWNEHRGVVAAAAVSATPLAAAQEKALAAAAAQLAGREVTLKSSVDPSLMGGVVLRMNGRTYDGSLRAQLQALRARLAPSGGPSPSNPRT